MIDEGRIAPQALDSATSLAAELVRLETLATEGPAVLRPILHRLGQRLQGPRYDSLRRALTVWVVRVLLRRLMPGEHLPEINDLLEVETMLAEYVEEWTEKWKREGLSEGLREGLREGKREGKLEGKRDSLKRLLRRRFADLPPWANARIDAATLDQLDLWLDGIFAAETLNTLLGCQSPENGSPSA